MSSDFAFAIKLVLDEECGFDPRNPKGFVNDVHDPGGATCMGITKRTLEGWRGRACTIAEVKALDRLEAMAIYRKKYWDEIRGDELPAGISLMVFDFGVNAGPSRSVKLLQAALDLTADGVIGPRTLAAAAAADPKALVRQFGAMRLAYYQSLPTYWHFGKGWAARSERIQKAALQRLTSVTPG